MPNSIEKITTIAGLRSGLDSAINFFVSTEKRFVRITKSGAITLVDKTEETLLALDMSDKEGLDFVDSDSYGWIIDYNLIIQWPYVPKEAQPDPENGPD